MGDAADLFDMLVEQEHEYDDGDQVNRGTCKRCGEPVEFIHDGMRWRVYAPGAERFHNCNPPIDTAEFKPIN